MLKITPESPVPAIPTPTFLFQPAVTLSPEDALGHAADLLRCASATACECADTLKGPQRDLAFAVMHLVQLAHGLVARTLDEKPEYSRGAGLGV